MNKRQKRRQKFYQAGVLILLVLIAFGFMVPGFINADPTTSNSIKVVEPRLCQADSDCYLTCDDEPVKILCSQNLCVQNSCEQGNPYIFQEKPLTFTLEMLIDGEPVDLSQRLSGNNLFTKLHDNVVEVHAFGLSLNHVLEKANAFLNQDCLFLGELSYCSNEEKKLVVSVNDEEEYELTYLTPQQGDIIKVIYS